MTVARWLAALCIFGVLGGGGAGASADEPVLTGAFASFHTNDDDKEEHTLLVVTIEKGHDQYASVVNIIGNVFQDHRDVGPFGLTIHGSIPKSALRGATTTLKIQPTADDTWKFNYVLELQYSDCTRQKYAFFTQRLNEGLGDTLRLTLE